MSELSEYLGAAAQIVWLTALATLGLSYSLLRWIDAVPPTDNRFRDRPPWGVRVLWWPVQWLGHYVERLAAPGWLRAAQRRLVAAGLDYAVTPAQWWAVLSLYAALCAGAGAVLAHALHMAPGLGGALGLGAGGMLPRTWLKDRAALRQRDTVKTLPFVLDLVTLCVEAGLNLNAALAQAVARGPQGPLRDELQRMLRDMRAGKARSDALRSFAERMNSASVSYLVSALIQAEATGMALAPVLRAQAEQRRAERFATAEKLAMEAPVKLLLPLIGFIFPCTFIVLGFPVAMKFMQAGL